MIINSIFIFLIGVVFEYMNTKFLLRSINTFLDDKKMVNFIYISVIRFILLLLIFYLVAKVYKNYILLLSLTAGLMLEKVILIIRNKVKV